MQRFFIEDTLRLGTNYTLSPSISHQLIKVLRHNIHDQSVLIDAQQNAYRVELITLRPAVVKVLECVEHYKHPKVKITLALSLLKRDKWEWALQKATELGVHQIIPIMTMRNVVKWDQDQRKLVRYQSILREASEQCERLDIPILTPPQKLRDLNQFPGLKLFADERNEAKSLASWLIDTKEVLIVIGPEGGFDPRERIELIQDGFQPVSLGPRILRSETAALYALSVIFSYYEGGR